MDSTPGWLRALARHSETASLIAAHDWSSTPLGPPDAWPESLRVTVGICLSSEFPIMLAWGPDLLMIYNEGYRGMLGSDKHPGAIGQPVQQVWREVWDEIGPLFGQVRSTRLAFNARHLPLEIVRNGYLEEAFFTFCYSPILQGDEVAGTLNIAMETTAEVVADRRLALLGRVAGAMVTARDITEVCTMVIAELGGTPDIVSAELRLWVDGRLVPVATSATPATTTGESDLATTVDAAPVVLDPDWAPGSPAGRAAMAVGSGDSAGVMVVGLNIHRPFDDGHRSFVELVGRTVGSALENAYRRAVELGEQRMISDTLQAAMLEPASDLPTVAARYRPASGRLSVGGDWYDVIGLPDGRRALVVGDCVGHGLIAAAAMGQLRSASRALLLDGRSPAEVLTAMDEFAQLVPNGSCATMACAVVDLDNLTVTYACAGHPPPLLVSDGTSTWLDGGRSGPLGFQLGPRGQADAPVTSGDLLLLYTDGLIERRHESIDVGLARLRAAAETHWRDSVQSIADALVEVLLEPRPGDDVVLLVKRVH